MNSPQTSLNGLARRLVADNLIDTELARKAITQAQKEKVSFVQYLVSSNFLDARTIAKVASEEFGTPVFDLDAFNKDLIISCGNGPNRPACTG
jgi:type IV pilus assembly protein PilB